MQPENQNEQHSNVITLDFGMVRAFLLKGEKRYILADTGTPGYDKKILAMLSGMDIDPRDISLILLTHNHIDHIGSVPAMKQATNAPVAMHLLDAEVARTGKADKLHAVNWKGRVASVLFRLMGGKMAHQPFEPDILIGGEMSLEDYGVAGKVIPTPGHTPGSLSILLESGEALVGDLIGGRKKPRYSPFGESLEAMRASIKVVLAHKPRIVFGSHGGPFTPEEIRQAFRL